MSVPRAPMCSRPTAACTIALAVLLGVLAAPLALVVPVTAQNIPPTAIISSPSDGAVFLVGDMVEFDARASIDDDLPNLTYEWNLSGTVVSGRDKALYQRAFYTQGDVLVVLRVVDSGGRVDTAFVTIQIRAENEPPLSVISTPLEGQRILNGRTIGFDGSASVDPDGGPLVYRWETNRTIDPIGDVPKFSVRLPVGHYRVTLFVYDQLGAAGNTSVNISVVIDVPPSLAGGAVMPALGPSDRPGGFLFTVVYTDPDNFPPEEINVKAGVGGRLTSYGMVPSVPDDEDYRDGRRYHAQVDLGPGIHSYVFSCSDMFYTCATVLFPGPEVYEVETVEAPLLRASTTVNWTKVGAVSMRSVASPGVTPLDTVMISKPVRITIESGTWSEARISLAYEVGHLADPDTITLLWYDSGRGLYVPTTGQRHDPDARTMEGDMPSDDVVMAVFGELSEGNQNNPPNLEISYDIEDAYVDRRLWFDASASSDPDGGALLFHWDFSNDGLPGPWVPGVTAYNVYEAKGTYQVVLRALDGQNEHFHYINVTIREEEDTTPGPLDNPSMLFLLGSLLVIAFGVAIAYRLHRPSTYDDLFGKAYRRRDEDEYSQLFRKLTQEELQGGWDEALDEAPEEGPGGDEEVDKTEEAEEEDWPEDGPVNEGPEEGGTEGKAGPGER